MLLEKAEEIGHLHDFKDYLTYCAKRDCVQRQDMWFRKVKARLEAERSEP